jgi:hypothetical protein
MHVLENSMTNTERTPGRAEIGEKVVWWGKIGGVVAAVLGMLTHAGELVLGGAGVSAVSIALEQTVIKRKDHAR